MGNFSLTQAYDNNWDGFAIDKVENGLLVGNYAVLNGRHGFNIITASRNVVIRDNFAFENGHFYMDGDVKGNGIMVQSNQGSEGTFLYVTNRITVSDNVVVGSKGSGIAFVETVQCSVLKNTITGSGYCILQTSTINSVARANRCIGGKGLKSVNNTGFVSDLNDNDIDSKEGDSASKNSAQKASMASLVAFLACMGFFLLQK
jgi:parallel beta-helix repeat protein